MWIDAIRDEMWFMTQNEVQELVELLENHKVIGHKWVFKINKGKD